MCHTLNAGRDIASFGLNNFSGFLGDIATTGGHAAGMVPEANCDAFQYIQS